MDKPAAAPRRARTVQNENRNSSRVHGSFVILSFVSLRGKEPRVFSRHTATREKSVGDIAAISATVTSRREIESRDTIHSETRRVAFPVSEMVPFYSSQRRLKRPGKARFLGGGGGWDIGRRR